MAVREAKVYVYRDTAREWRWRVIAANGQEIGRSEESYARRTYCERVARKRNPGLSVVVEA
jgi:uncharacterized protein YegP (UPF0339 family)